MPGRRSFDSAAAREFSGAATAAGNHALGGRYPAAVRQLPEIRGREHVEHRDERAGGNAHQRRAARREVSFWPGKAGTEATDLRCRRRPRPADGCHCHRHHAAGSEIQRRLRGAGVLTTGNSGDTPLRIISEAYVIISEAYVIISEAYVIISEPYVVPQTRPAPQGFWQA